MVTMVTMASNAESTGNALPPGVSGALDRFVAAARDSFGPLLKSVVLFGSAAEGRLRATSDVNVLVVLSAWDEAKAAPMREPLRTANAAVRLEAMFLLDGEVGAAVAAFPAKFADMLRRRRVLFGADPLAGLAVPREAEIAHLRQVLLNLALRLRERWLLASLREEQAARALAEAAGPLRSSAASLLALSGRPAPSPKEALATLASSLPGEGWDEVLEHLSAAREGRPLPAGAAPASLGRLAGLAQALLEKSRSLS